MKPFEQHIGVCADIPINNVDTDQIIPSREMNRVSKQGLGEGLFAGWRYLYEGTEKVGENSEFVLNKPAFANTSILLSAQNFGCGSSREHAVWALRDFGIRVIIAESFGRIFKNNCARNGILAIPLAPESIRHLREQTQHDPQTCLLSVDLAQLTITTPDGNPLSFDMPTFDREMLLKGLDYIDYTLQFESDIESFIKEDSNSRPWAHL
ncbi:MAG: 3-isopropylmalate dehydratase small subunit [Pseudomonadota bacterium]